MPTSPKSFQQEQTKIELDIIRTKLKQTETALKDSNDMNAILSARNKLFEEKRLTDAHDNLFKKSHAVPTLEPPPMQPTPPLAATTPSPTIESLINLELLKSLRAVSQPPHPTTLLPHQSSPPISQSDVYTKLDLVQGSLNQILSILGALNQQVATLDAKLTLLKTSSPPTESSSNNSRTSEKSSQTSFPPLRESVIKSVSASPPKTSPPLLLPCEYNPAIPPPPLNIRQPNPRVAADPRPPPTTAYYPPATTVPCPPPPPRNCSAPRRFLLPTPYPLS